MFLTSCPRCSRRVSRHAGVCAACGAGLTSPASRLGTGGQVVLRTSQVLAAALAMYLAVLGSDSQVLPAFMRSGSVVGAAVAPLLLSALFLAWTRGTREWIPFLALGFSVLTLLGGPPGGARGGSETGQEVLSTRGGGSVPRPGAKPRKPSGREGKVAWATNRMMEDITAFEWEAAGRHGVKMNRPPSSFMTPGYIASAGSHPAVMDYWRRMDALLEELQRTQDGVAAAKLEARAREAGLSPREIDAMVRGSRERMEQLNQARRRHQALGREVAGAAQALHRHLVSVDARVRLESGSGTVLFESEADAKRLERLAERLRAASEALARHDREQYRAARNALRVQLYRTSFP